MGAGPCVVVEALGKARRVHAVVRYERRPGGVCATFALLPRLCGMADQILDPMTAGSGSGLAIGPGQRMPGKPCWRRAS